MKFSESWLREWINPEINTEKLCDQLTMAGLEVDNIAPVARNFDGVVIGRVVECAKHPNADKLHVTKVDVGASTLLNIVCGAENCRQGLTVACAKVGARLPGNVKIKATKLRGELSEGMLCSYAELGMDSNNAVGIIELPYDATLGEDIRHYLQLSDCIIDVSITPNRADCFSIIGIARDIAAMSNLPLTEPKHKLPAVSIDNKMKVSIDESIAVPRYLTRIVKGINIHTPTPLWIKEKLRRSGIRSIDAVVDVTNYVMIELGQPMHAFDLHKIAGSIVVHYGKSEEKLTLLDGNEIKIKEKTLVISDEEKVLALAGISGGLSSGVSKETTDIMLEAAFFSPLVLAGKAREYGLHTESSHRFERGVDPELSYRAMERATALLLAITGGFAGPISEAVCNKFLPKPAVIALETKKIDQLLGCAIDQKCIIDIFTRLGFRVKFCGNLCKVMAPSWRFDIQIEADLIEEIARIYGYNNIPNAYVKAKLALRAHPEEILSLSRVKYLLVDRGYQEAITYSFVDPKIQSLLHPEQSALMLPNPISSEMSAMRLSLWSGLLNTVLYNQSRQQYRLRLFETGFRFIPDESAEFGVRQETVLSGVIVGSLYEEHWHLSKKSVDFFDLKGDIEMILSLTGRREKFFCKPFNHPALHPGQSAAWYLNNEMMGIIGTLHPQIQKQLDIKGNVIVFELLWEKIAKRVVPELKNISRFPANRRDIAILVDNDVLAGDIITECKRVGGDSLVNVSLFDVYEGDNIIAGKKSLAISLILQDNLRTLEDNDIINVVDKCIEALQNRFNASLRE